MRKLLLLSVTMLLFAVQVRPATDVGKCVVVNVLPTVKVTPVIVPQVQKFEIVNITTPNCYIDISPIQHVTIIAYVSKNYKSFIKEVQAYSFGYSMANSSNEKENLA